MTESGFLELKSTILTMLRKGLDPVLTYHSPAHTEDVLQQVERIAAAEKITESRTILLMRIAALFHDTGFLRTYREHEQQSCIILRESVNACEFDENELDLVTGMIMATRIPQLPKSLPEMVLCDADLDYLGRTDFAYISDLLKQEFLAKMVIQSEDEWNKLQVKFFESHNYFTPSSIRDRRPVKEKHLEQLKQKLQGLDF
jgi:predicted metal-dependent HD superfamily phosphohydrolase